MTSPGDGGGGGGPSLLVFFSIFQNNGNQMWIRAQMRGGYRADGVRDGEVVDR